MAGRNALAVIAEEVVALLDPLRRIIADPNPPHELLALLRRAGWVLPGIAGLDLQTLNGQLNAIVTAVDGLPAAVTSANLADLTAALAATADAVAALDDLNEVFDDVLGSLGVAVPADLPAVLASDVADALVLSWLAGRHSTGFGILQALHLVTIIDLPALAATDGTVLRPGGLALRLAPDTVPQMLGDPVGFLTATYGFVGGPADTLDAQALTLLLASRARALAGKLGGDLLAWPPGGSLEDLDPADRDAASRTLGVRLHLPTPDPTPLHTTIGVDLVALSPSDRGELGRTGPGLELRTTGLQALTTVRGAWTIDLTSASVPAVVFVGAGEVVTDDGTALTATAVLARTEGDGVVLGGDAGTRLELSAPVITLGIDLDDEPDLAVEVVVAPVRLVVTTGDGDSFLAGVLPDIDLEVEFDLGLAWSLLGGLRLSGSPDLVARFSVNQTLLGLLTLEAVETALELVGDQFRLVIVVDGSFRLGPFTARVEGVGLRIIIALTGDGNLGIADLAVEFQPPRGFEFEILLGETVIGGGFVRHDPATGRYWGALGLKLLCIELGAIAVVDTRLPGDPDGWALFASLFLTFPSVPLGFGFFLSGVGGIVCLNRTMDSMAIAAGLREGAVDLILFPDDPVNDAEEIIAELDAWFPLAAGATVFGLAATITWGTPSTIITGQLGVMLALPDIEIAVIGSIELVLPADKPVLQIHLDTLGSYVAAEQTLLIMASLYDSTLLGTIDLSGDMAMYSRFGSNPYFLLSVGGYHPDFKPPVGLPSVIRDLRRIRAEVAISDDVWYSLETYVAVTSNTFQFGALASFEASTRFLGATYTASGHVGFDVLLHFSPFSFVASFTAGVSVTSGDNDREIVAAELEARLEGPEPWYATGYGRFSFLGIGVRFEVAVGGPAGIEVRVRKNVLDAVVLALEALSSWGEADAGPSPVTMAQAPTVETDDDTDTPSPDVLRIRPDADVRVSQTIAPLNRRMDIYGLYDIDGPDELRVTGTGIIGLSTTSSDAVVDWFAPAQYDDLTRAEKLSAPSYEEMDAGVTISAGGVSSGPGSRTISPTYEVVVVNGLQVTTAVGQRPPFGERQTLNAGAVMDSAIRFGRTRTADLPDAFAFREPTWTLADAQTGRPVGPAGRYSTMLARARRRTGVVAVPSHAVRDAASAPA